jgi:hypothetical protein
MSLGSVQSIEAVLIYAHKAGCLQGIIGKGLGRRKMKKQDQILSWHKEFHDKG